VVSALYTPTEAGMCSVLCILQIIELPGHSVSEAKVAPCMCMCVVSDMPKHTVQEVLIGANVVYLPIHDANAVNTNTYGLHTVRVVPMPKVTLNIVKKLFTQLKAPSTSSKRKKLDFIYKLLAFTGNSASWGAVWGPVRIMHPLWQGKGAIMNSHRPLL